MPLGSQDIRLKEACFPGGGKDSLNIVITLTQMDFFFSLRSDRPVLSIFEL